LAWSRARQVAQPQQPPRAVFEDGDPVAGLLEASGRLGQPPAVLFAPGGRKVKQARLVARAGIDQAGKLVEFGAKLMLATGLSFSGPIPARR
jgi:hypothetical protein